MPEGGLHLTVGEGYGWDGFGAFGLLHQFSDSPGLINALTGAGIMLGVASTATLASISVLQDATPLILAFIILLLSFLSGYYAYKQSCIG